MFVVIVIVVAIAAFLSGFGAASLIWRARIRSEEYLRHVINDAYQKGVLGVKL